MKSLIILALFTFSISSNAFAITDDELIAKCLKTGEYKLNLYAQLHGCEISDIEADSVDNRWYNPSKYIWYAGLVKCANNLEIIKMVQYSEGTCR